MFKIDLRLLLVVLQMLYWFDVELAVVFLLLFHPCRLIPSETRPPVLLLLNAIVRPAITSTNHNN